MKIRIKRLVPEAVVPQKAHASDAGFDLVAVRAEFKEGCWVCGTGWALEIPEGYVGLVFPRSSIVRKDMSMANAVGVIDAGYRGEVTCRFRLTGNLEFPRYGVGERVAQIVFMKLADVELQESEELSESERGEGGYGSTGR